MGKYIKKFIIAAGIIVYGVVFSEMFLRLFAPQPMIPRHVSAAWYGIRGNKPNATYWHIAKEYKVKLQTNSKGIRSPREIPFEKPEGVKRIVLLGDSFGMGYEVDYEDMFSTRMEKYLQQDHGLKVEVVNLSTSGHGNAEQLIVLKNEGLKYDPDLVLLAWHSTDIQDNIRSGLYSLDSEGSLVRKNTTYLPAIEIREKLEKMPLYSTLEQYSNFYSFFRERAGSQVQQWLALYRAKQVTAKPQRTEEDNRDNYARSLCLALLSEIKTLCSKHQIEFMILNIPRRSGRRIFRSAFPIPSADALQYYSFYCPIEDFKPYLGQKLYWEHGHGHFTPLGCDIVGKGLSDYIENNQLLFKEIDNIAN